MQIMQSWKWILTIFKMIKKDDFSANRCTVGPAQQTNSYIIIKSSNIKTTIHRHVLKNTTICLYLVFFPQFPDNIIYSRTSQTDTLPSLFPSMKSIEIDVIHTKHEYHIASNKRRLIQMALECYNYNALVYNWSEITLILATSICTLLHEINANGSKSR